VKIVVNDTNILNDLVDLDLLEGFTKLNYELHTNDFIISEIEKPEQLVKIQQIEKTGKLIIATTEAKEYIEISKLQTKNLTFEDCSVWYYAKKVNGTLLTGDNNLRNSALKSGIDVKGIFFIFDKLVENQIINKKTALEKLVKLEQKNSRLPKNEIEKRKTEWSS